MNTIIGGACICGICGILFSFISCLLFLLYQKISHKIIEKTCIIGFIVAICCFLIAAILGLIGFIELAATTFWAM